MKIITHNITLDVASPHARGRMFEVKRKDGGTHTINFTLTENGTAISEYDGVTSYRIRVLHMDKSSTETEYTDFAGTIKHTLSAADLGVFGDALCEVSLYDDSGSRLTSAAFGFFIVPDINTDEGVLNDSNYPVLDNLIKTVNENLSGVESMTKKANDLIAKAETVGSNASNLEEALQTINNNVNAKANEVKSNSDRAETAADSANSAMSRAETAANSSETEASKAQSAKEDAIAAQEAAETAKQDAQSAKEYAEQYYNNIQAYTYSKDDANLLLADKVDKVEGKDLSTNDFTDAYKAEVAKVKDKANIYNVLTKDNTTEYTPSTDYNPATKKYVDDIDKELTLIDERLKYYGDKDIIPSDESYFTVNETGETITGLTDAGKEQTELVIPYEIDGVKITKLENIGTSILAGNSVITKVILPNSIVTIGNNAFQHCTSLSSINIPSSVTSIGLYAFSGCTGLTSINIPNSVISIGAYIFSYCSSLTSINIPNNVTHIYYRAFLDCTKLTSITIPNSVTSIDDTSFDGCTNLTIYCEQGSYAETFANTNNIPVKYTDVDLSNYVEKDGDKVLSTNDYTDTDKAEVAKIKDKVGFTDYATDTKAGIVTAYGIGGISLGNNGELSLHVPTEYEIDSRQGMYGNLPITISNLDYAVRSVLPVRSGSIPDKLAANTIYGLGIESTLTLNLPSIEAYIATGDFIQVDFYSGETPTNLTITCIGGRLSDIDLIPEANTMYSLFFDWGTVYCDPASTALLPHAPGWRFSYAAYPHKEV